MIFLLLYELSFSFLLWYRFMELFWIPVMNLDLSLIECNEVIKIYFIVRHDLCTNPPRTSPKSSWKFKIHFRQFFTFRENEFQTYYFRIFPPLGKFHFILFYALCCCVNSIYSFFTLFSFFFGEIISFLCCMCKNY